MKNRLLNILLAAALLFGLLSVSVFAAEIVDSGTCGENLTWELDSDGVLTISGTGEMDHYGWYHNEFYGDSPWANYSASISQVLVESGVTGIGRCAFSGCEAITEARIADTVTAIGDEAFYCCTALTTVIFGRGVTEIGNIAFHFCESLESACFLGDAPTLGNSVFCTLTIKPGQTAPSGCVIPGLTLYYLEGKEGWTTPTWNGYPTAIWDGVNIPSPPVSETFSDVPAGEWFTEAIQYAVDNELMNGMGGDQFRPNANMNRAMLVTILWRYAGSPTGYSHSFTDVTEDWYADAVAWANSNHIVEGISDTKFGPKQALTREQLATILYRYCQVVGIDTTISADLSAYPDASSISTWAKDAMEWAVGAGLISGMDKGGVLHLNPSGKATRAQVAMIFMRFIENVIE